ncbi:hypothetical protein N7453_008301 [Penicillium expansum]|nr:hypothetical protein N7453_008301 [Penicillium expansum]
MDGVGHTYTDFTSMEIYLQESICGIVALLQSAVKKSYRTLATKSSSGLSLRPASELQQAVWLLFDLYSTSPWMKIRPIITTHRSKENIQDHTHCLVSKVTPQEDCETRSTGVLPDDKSTVVTVSSRRRAKISSNSSQEVSNPGRNRAENLVKSGPNTEDLLTEGKK